MTKYIEAARAATIIAEKRGIPIADLVDTFAEIPSADVAPIIHGHWNEINQITTGLPWKYRCSDCGCPQEYTHNYCPNCGARMDKEEE